MVLLCPLQRAALRRLLGQRPAGKTQLWTLQLPLQLPNDHRHVLPSTPSQHVLQRMLRGVALPITSERTSSTLWLQTTHGQVIRGFDRPPQSELDTAAHFAYFLSHRGPDTKLAVVGAVSFILRQLGVEHFFDKHSLDESKYNDRQMALAAHKADMGVLFFSPKFRDSDWTVKEANTFLHRQREAKRRAMSPSSSSSSSSSSSWLGGLVYPVYWDVERDEFPLFKSVSSSLLLGKGESNRTFVLRVVRALLSVRQLQHRQDVREAHQRVEADVAKSGGQLCEGWIDEYLDQIMVEVRAITGLEARPPVPARIQFSNSGN